MSNGIGENIDTHESYGLVSFSRINCGGGGLTLFGSSIKHGNIISLRIKRGEVDRHLNEDWYHGKESLIEVYMSPVQFADVITHMNRGEGIPCTIQRVNGKKMEQPTFKSKTELFKKEIEKDVSGMLQSINDLFDYVSDLIDNKKPFNKAEKENIKGKIAKLDQDLRSNMPFVLDQLQRQMNKTVKEAKGEVEAYVSHLITETGIKALKENTPKLLEGDN